MTDPTSAVREIWTQLHAAIQKAAPSNKTVQLEGNTHYQIKIDNQPIPFNVVLEVHRDNKKHNSAVPGFHTYTYTGTYSIRIGTLTSLCPMKRFPQLRSGGHNYQAIAFAFWKAVSYVQRKERDDNASRALRDSIPEEVRRTPFGYITASSRPDRVTASIAFNRDLTVNDAIRLMTLLKTFDATRTENT